MDDDGEDPVLIKEEKEDPVKVQNPWTVESLEDFLHYCCPECDVKSKSKELFVNHAALQHPEAHATLSNFVLLSDYLVNEDDIDVKEEYSEDEALEDHLNDNDIDSQEDCLSPPEKKPKVLKQDDEPVKIKLKNRDPPGQSYQEQVQCYLCGDCFLTGFRVRKHIRNIHGRTGSQTLYGPPKENVNDHQCYYCGHLTTIWEIRNHIRSKHNVKGASNYGPPKEEYRSDKETQCYYCGKIMPFEEVIEHIKMEHSKRYHSYMFGPPREFQCKPCGAAFETQLKMDRHTCIKVKRLERHADGLYHCTICDKTSPKQRTMKVHIQSVHHEERNFECKLCGFKTKGGQTLMRHERTVHFKEVRHFCSDCGHGFYDKAHLKKHMRTHVTGVPDHPSRRKRRNNGDFSYLCSVCDQIFDSVWKRNEHMKELHGLGKANVKKEKCNNCGLMIHARWMECHSSMDHPTDQDLDQFVSNLPVVTGRRKANPYTCHLCPSKHETSTLLSAHVAKEHRKLVHACQHCHFRTKYLTLFQYHVDKQHTSGPDNKVVRDLCCDLCGKLITTLEYHMNIRHRSRCTIDQCNMILEGQEDAQTHLMTCHNVSQTEAEATTLPSAYTNPQVNPILCTICGRTLHSNQALTIHIKSVHAPAHAKELSKNHVCDQCGFRTAHQVVLNRHIKAKHTKSQLFYCDRCPFKNHISTSVKTHIKMVHENYRPNKCDHCDSAFGYKRDLQRHMERVHGVTIEKTVT